jgi:hypothetical protein
MHWWLDKQRRTENSYVGAARVDDRSRYGRAKTPAPQSRSNRIVQTNYTLPQLAEGILKDTDAELLTETSCSAQ